MNNKNIFMKFCFVGNDIKEEEKKTIFVYSNAKGLQHLDNLLSENPVFYNLITSEEIVVKMAEQISYNQASNHNTGNFNSAWYGRQILFDCVEQPEVNTLFKEWRKQLDNLFGSENISEVCISSKVFKQQPQYLDDALLNFLNSYTLNNSLEENLNNKENNAHNKSLKKKI